MRAAANFPSALWFPLRSRARPWFALADAESPAVADAESPAVADARGGRGEPRARRRTQRAARWRMLAVVDAGSIAAAGAEGLTPANAWRGRPRAGARQDGEIEHQHVVSSSSAALLLGGLRKPRQEAAASRRRWQARPGRRTRTMTTLPAARRAPLRLHGCFVKLRDVTHTVHGRVRRGQEAQQSRHGRWPP